MYVQVTKGGGISFSIKEGAARGEKNMRRVPFSIRGASENGNEVLHFYNGGWHTERDNYSRRA